MILQVLTKPLGKGRFAKIWFDDRNVEQLENQMAKNSFQGAIELPSVYAYQFEWLKEKKAKEK